ncbi:MAG: U32 family peptidase [Tidjanibacter sp.]|nr:U32 family peptidase [Tidjanibacter sp.]MBR4038023.1 U32 family peptidase [Tidjanibacter sp.]MBR4063852.1 U32 family peptidase [Tidjanibacter sp.]MBR6813300.1 U32 family peptidase [Tidjanibacter sp.]MBR7103030.1 U32 family peptidase [Tidjanibacter sp.]
MKRKDIEIMAPVGSYESLVAAVAAGANSVYFGIGALNMRAASAANFGADDMAEIVEYAHSHGVKAYLTVNTIVYEEEIALMRTVLDAARDCGVDAVIISDQAAIEYASKIGLEVHISTQLNISNSETLRFYSRWADVVVLARELSLDRIATIARKIEEEHICGPSGELVKIEMFAHGAICMAISGKCYLSLHDNGCSANRGACRQICRHSYTLRDKDDGKEIAVDGQYLLSPKDLCTIDFLDKFIDAGVRVLKIEGRARGAEYVKRVVECYDEALQMMEAGTYTPESAEALKERLATVFNRGFWGGYYLAQPAVELSKRYGSSATEKKVYVGKITNIFKKIGVAEVAVEASPFESGSRVVVLGKTTGAVEFTVGSVYVDEKPAEVAPQGVLCSIEIPEGLHRGDKIYKWVAEA